MVCSSVAAVSEAEKMPIDTGISVAPPMIVRYRVGVYSTIIGNATADAAPTPNPTAKRKTENNTHAPSGIRQIEPDPRPQIATPAARSFLRPQRSPTAPQASEATIAPIPP